MKVRIVTTQNLSATQVFFSPAVSCAVVSAPRHIAVFVDFHPRGFHFGFLQKPGDGGDPKWKPAAAPFPLKDGCNSLNMFKRAP